MIEKTKLENGVRVLSDSVPGLETCSLGLWMQAGTRWDPPGQGGLAHFLEHMAFKGTARRTALQLAQDMDMLGGRMNAFTEQEQTCFYTVALGEHVAGSLEIMADMLLNSCFASEELKREQGVVCEEIKMVDDDPSELASDLFYEALWKEHPLGLPIQGTAESVGSFDRNMLFDFQRRFYKPERLVVAAAGKVDHREFVRLADKYFGGHDCFVSSAAPSSAVPAVPEPDGLPGGVPVPCVSNVVRRRPTEQVSICCGWQVPPFTDKSRWALSVLDNVLGDSLSCRLFQEIREKNGLAYSIETMRSSYRDAGLFGVEAGTSAVSVAEVMESIRRIFSDIRRDGITADELERARQHIRISYALEFESTSGRMASMVQNEVLYGRQMPLAELYGQLDGVTRDSVRDFAAEYLDPDRMTAAAVGPLDSL